MKSILCSNVVPGRCRMSDIRVFGGTSHPDLTRRIVDRLGVDVGRAVAEKFGNLETWWVTGARRVPTTHVTAPDRGEVSLRARGGFPPGRGCVRAAAADPACSPVVLADPRLGKIRAARSTPRGSPKNGDRENRTRETGQLAPVFRADFATGGFP